MQLALDLGDLRPLPPEHGRNDSYFFAVMPDAVTALRIDAQARAETALQPQWRSDRDGTISFSLWGLAPPAGSQETVVERMMRAGAAVSAGAFALRFDQVLSFSKDARMHPFVLSSSDNLPALNALQMALGSAMAELGLTGPLPFTPHVTMLYDKTLVAPTAIPSIAWTAHDFVLLKSFHGQSRYEYLRIWPLRPIARAATSLT